MQDRHPYDTDEDREISLIDILRTLRKRLKLIVTVVGVALALGLFLALVKPRQHAFTTVVEIGSQVLGDKISLVEPPDTVLAKLAEGYIPQTLSERFRAGPSKGAQLSVKASIPKASQIVVLKSVGPLTQEREYLEIHEKIVQRLRADHQRIVSLIKKGIANQVAESKGRLAALVDEEGMMKAKLQRLDESEAILRSEMESIRALVAVADQNRGKAMREVNNEAKAMTMIMLTNELQQNRARLSALDERAQVQLKNERDELTKALSDNIRTRANTTSQIERLQLSLANLQDTRAIIAPMRSPRPVGPRRALTLALFATLGCVAGVIGALIAESFSKASQQGDAEAAEQSPDARLLASLRKQDHPKPLVPVEA